MSVKTRITLLIAGAGFFPSLLFSVVVFYELVEQPFDLLDSVLEEEAYSAVRMNLASAELQGQGTYVSTLRIFTAIDLPLGAV